MTLWAPRIAPAIESPEAGIRAMSWDEAQLYSNFVLMRPGSLPTDCVIATAEMRPESPPGRPVESLAVGHPDWTTSNRSAHRAIVRGERREMRIKQFLYDWAPPAFDHPSLWLSPSVRPFLIGDDVAWIGLDFRKRQAAAVQLHRTTIELAVTAGRFPDSELEAIVHGMEEAYPAASQLIDATPFAQLSYQKRHITDVVTVPVGYWAHKRVPAAIRTTALTSGETPAVFPGRDVAPPARLGYTLDSCFALGDLDSPLEIEYLYRHLSDVNWHIRVLVWPSGSPASLSFPPFTDQQPCSHRQCSINGVPVFYAFATEHYGQHEAVWKTKEYTVMLLAKPVRWTNSAWFFGLLHEIVASN